MLALYLHALLSPIACSGHIMAVLANTCLVGRCRGCEIIFCSLRRMQFPRKASAIAMDLHQHMPNVPDLNLPPSSWTCCSEESRFLDPSLRFATISTCQCSDKSPAKVSDDFQNRGLILDRTRRRGHEDHLSRTPLYRLPFPDIASPVSSTIDSSQPEVSTGMSQETIAPGSWTPRLFPDPRAYNGQKCRETTYSTRRKPLDNQTPQTIASRLFLSCVTGILATSESQSVVAVAVERFSHGGFSWRWIKITPHVGPLARRISEMRLIPRNARSRQINPFICEPFDGDLLLHDSLASRTVRGENESGQAMVGRLLYTTSEKTICGFQRPAHLQGFDAAISGPCPWSPCHFGQTRVRVEA